MELFINKNDYTNIGLRYHKKINNLNQTQKNQFELLNVAIRHNLTENAWKDIINSKMVQEKDIPVMKNMIKQLETLNKDIVNYFWDKDQSIAYISIIDLIVIWNLNSFTLELISHCIYQFLLNRVNEIKLNKLNGQPKKIIYGPPYTGEIYEKIFNEFNGNYDKLNHYEKEIPIFFFYIYGWF